MLAAALGFIASAVAASGPAQLRWTSATPRVDSHRRSRPVAPARAEVTVAAHARMTTVPRSFLGFSTEYWALPQWDEQMALLERVLALVRVPGDGPLVVRVGGDSADHSFWDPQQIHLPRWAFTIQPRWLVLARQLVRQLGVRLILDLNLVTDGPAQATEWAQAAQAALPPHSILAFEVGNEPDIYSRHAWVAITAGRPYLDRPLPRTLSAGDYVRDFRAYAGVLRQIAPHVMLAGPALARPAAHADWIRTLIAGARSWLGMVTVHRYPLAGCARQPSDAFPTIGRLLRPQLAEGMATALRPVIDIAHDAGLPVRLSELNSVNCGGRPGVSDTFATTLWAPDALFALLHAGVDGVNLHIRADTINAPFALSAAGLDARPLLYGLILFDHALGLHAHLTIPSIRTARSTNLAAYAVRTGANVLRVVLIDRGSHTVRVALRLPATADASVQRLIAPSAGSRSGVTFGGRRLDRDGRWVGTAHSQVLSRRGGAYQIELRGPSAALVTVALQPGALGAPAT